MTLRAWLWSAVWVVLFWGALALVVYCPESMTAAAYLVVGSLIAWCVQELVYRALRVIWGG